VEFLGVPDKDWAIAKRRLEMIRQLVLVKDRTSRDVEKRAKKCKVSAPRSTVVDCVRGDPPAE